MARLGFRTPEVSLGLGLATATVAFAVYKQGVPTMADIRTGEPQSEDIESARKQSAWMAAAVVGAISLLAKDTTIFIVGGLTVVALDVTTRFNNAVNPITGSALEFNLFDASEPQVEGGVPTNGVEFGSDVQTIA